MSAFSVSTGSAVTYPCQQCFLFWTKPWVLHDSQGVHYHADIFNSGWSNHINAKYYQWLFGEQCSWNFSPFIIAFGSRSISFVLHVNSRHLPYNQPLRQCLVGPEIDSRLFIFFFNIAFMWSPNLLAIHRDSKLAAFYKLGLNWHQKSL